MLSRIKRKPQLLLFVLLLCMFLFSLMFKVYGQGFIPMESLKNLGLMIRLLFSKIFNTDFYNKQYETIRHLPYFSDTIMRLKTAFVTCVGGMAISAGGAVFQTMFKNPLASPNMIGVSSGVSLGNVLYIYAVGTAATTGVLAETTRYMYCYISAGVMIALVLFFGKIVGIRTKRFSVLDMIIVGSIISRFAGSIVTYMEYILEGMDVNLLLMYQQYTMGGFIPTDTFSILMFTICIFVSIAPIILIRFRFNALSFNDDDIKYMGINPTTLRFVGLLCGGLLSVTALIFCGDVGMVSMVIPHICRYAMGADFRKVCINSIFLGGTLTLFSRILASLISFNGMYAPVNFFTSIIILPAFIYIMTKRRSAFAE